MLSVESSELFDKPLCREGLQLGLPHGMTPNLRRTFRPKALWRELSVAGPDVREDVPCARAAQGRGRIVVGLRLQNLIPTLNSYMSHPVFMVIPESSSEYST